MDGIELITTLFDNLNIENEKSENDEMMLDTYHNTIITIKKNCQYNNFFKSIIEIIDNEFNFTCEIAENIIVINNILYAINMQSTQRLKALLIIPIFYSKKIPRRSNHWWDRNCSEFKDSMNHLRNSSYDDSDNYTCRYYMGDIRKEIINLTIEIIQKDYKYKKIEHSTSLLVMYQIAQYLESKYFKSDLFVEEFHYKNEYFNVLNEQILEIITLDPNINCIDKSIINLALLKVLIGAKNTLILFGPYGYNALYENSNIINLDLQSIFEFKKEALEYFALQNIIELKLNNKKVKLNNPNEYLNIVFRGALLLD